MGLAACQSLAWLPSVPLESPLPRDTDAAVGKASANERQLQQTFSLRVLLLSECMRPKASY